MTSPFFSICIAAYKADRYIDECLRSIAAQSYSDYEVVIVDDGSPEPLKIDASVREALSDCRVVRTENRGPYAARQEAFDLAQGEAILCVDADDMLLDPQALSKIKVAFACGVDVVLFNASCSRRDMKEVLDFSSLGPGGLVDPDAIWSAYTTGTSLNSLWCKAFRRPLYGVAPKKSRPRLLMAEDRLQSLEIMREARSFCLIDEPLYFYRPNPASITNAGYDPAFFQQQCYVESQVLEFMHGCGMSVRGWAGYFLGHTSDALLGIRYNASLTRSDRLSAYARAVEEPVMREALGYFDEVDLTRVARSRLALLRAGRHAALDASMLPWKVGSVLKHLVK